MAVVLPVFWNRWYKTYLRSQKGPSSGKRKERSYRSYCDDRKSAGGQMFHRKWALHSHLWANTLRWDGSSFSWAQELRDAASPRLPVHVTTWPGDGQLRGTSADKDSLLEATPQVRFPSSPCFLKIPWPPAASYRLCSIYQIIAYALSFCLSHSQNYRISR